MVPKNDRRGGGPRRALAAAGLALVAAASLGNSCDPGTLVVLPGSGSALFLGPPTNPLALSGDGQVLYVANPASGTVTLVDVSTPSAPVLLAEVKVGLEPTGLAVRPKVDPGDPLEDELVFVANHVSDSIGVVSRTKRDLVNTIQALDANGVTTTDEPVAIAFASPTRAFVSLDQPNQVLVLDGIDGAGNATILPTRIHLTAQAPRALAVAAGKLFVAAFESGNRTEFPLCGPTDPRGLQLGNSFDQGCEFKLTPQFLAMFAQSPNVGGRVIRDGNLPDRDLFVYDAATLAPAGSPVEGVGTLLYGLATNGSRVFVTNTDARNVQNGLAALGNRMFDNRLSFADCGAGCGSLGAFTHVDLDAAAPGATTVPTPYGVAVSGDGQTVLVTASGADGGAGFPGLFVLTPAGAVQGSVGVGAIPQGVALRSGPGGAAQTAFVANAADGSVSVVDVSTPAAPALLATLATTSDPTPTAVRRGRIAFGSARASTNGTFSCESCHPNGNTDQLLWTINTIAAPGATDPGGVKPEPRTTMPVRGLRDTLPFHWDGSLGDPVAGVFVPGDTAPDCSLANGELECFRDIVDASLSGVMCAQPGCAPGPSGLPGGLTATERDDMARFLTAALFPPSPARRPTDALGATALQGVRDFFTNDDGGGLVALSCADVQSGCHALPLGVATNSSTVGGFDAPSVRGMWDRMPVFSNAIFNTEEVMALVQAQAPGLPIWNPATGPTKRGMFFGTFPAGFTPGYNLPPDRIWEFINQMSVGLPGLTGRQLTITPANATSAATIAALAQIEAAADATKITAVARSSALGEYRYEPASDRWLHASSLSLTGTQLRENVVSLGRNVTITAELPETMQAAGPRQPLLSPQLPDTGLPDVPRPAAGGSVTLRLAQSYVDANAKVLVDGAPCAACSVVLTTGTGGQAVADVLLSPVPVAGTHVVQVLNPKGYASNEMPFIAQ